MTNFRGPAETFSPGEYLRDELDARGWTQIDLAAILGRPLRLVSDVILGKRGITPETATGLAKALGTSAELWLNLDAAYQLSKVQAPTNNLVERRARLYSKAPIKEMVRRHWIKHSDSIDVLERRVLDFFGKASLDEDFGLAYAAKKSTSYETVTPAQAAWMARARQLAPTVSARSYSRGSIDALLGDLRNLMHAPEEARLVPRTLASAGIRFLIVEPLPGTGIDGLSFWLDSVSPVIAMSLRFDRIDNFWFVLLHELTHIEREDGLRGRPALDIEIESSGDKPPQEKVANNLAGQRLIPQRELKDFIIRNNPLFSTFKIQGFANRIHIHPGIVVGRLQHLEVIDWSHHRRLLASIRKDVTQVALTDGWGHIAPTGL
jgi:HTH-type transcriptional regulator / antitoxin HigA